MMRRTLTAAMVALSLLVLAPAAAAQAEESGAVTLGLDGIVTIPVGDWADVTGVGIGALVRGEYFVLDPLSLTGRVGYIYNMSTDLGVFDTSTHLLPVLLGARYYSDIGVWGGAELGLFAIFPDVEGPSGVSIDEGGTETKFGMLLSGGYRFGNVDVSAGLILPEVGELAGIFFSLGFDFASF